MVTAEQKALAIARLKTWIAKIPLSMRDMPVLVLLGRALTPMQMLAEAEAGTPIGSIIVDRELKMAGLLLGR